MKLGEFCKATGKYIVIIIISIMIIKQSERT